MSDLMATPLDRSKPALGPLRGRRLPRRLVLVSRMHHCIADGIALARVMLSLTDGGPQEPEGFTVTSGGGLPLGGLARSAGALAHEAIAAVRHPRHAVAGAVEDAATLAKLLLPGADPRSAIKGDQRISHHVGWSEPLELWRVKQTARALSATVNECSSARSPGRSPSTCAHPGRSPPRCTRSCRWTYGRSTLHFRASSATNSGSCCSACPSASRIRWNERSR